MKRQIKTVPIYLLAFFILITPILANSLKVNDFANLLSIEEMEILEERLITLTETYNIDVAIATTDDTNGKTTAAYADDFYDENGYGIGANDDGLLLLIDMQHREVYISTYALGTSYLSDDRITALLDKIYPYLSDADYYKGIAVFLDQLEAYFNKGIPSSNTDIDYTQVPSEPLPHVPFKDTYGHPLTTQNILICVIIALIGGLIIAFIAKTIVSYCYKHPRHTVPSTAPDKSSVHYTEKNDHFMSTHTTKTKIQTSNSSGGSSGGSSIHRSSSGRSHGGGGRGF